jgi:hypothetical protein
VATLTEGARVSAEYGCRDSSGAVSFAVVIIFTALVYSAGAHSAAVVLVGPFSPRYSHIRWPRVRRGTSRRAIQQLYKLMPFRPADLSEKRRDLITLTIVLCSAGRLVTHRFQGVLCSGENWSIGCSSSGVVSFR